jgi:TonB family protein
MSRSTLKALLVAVFIHGSILLFGGLLLVHASKPTQVREDVDLLTDDSQQNAEQKQAEQKQQDEAKASEADSRITAEAEKMPDLHEIQNLESPASGPALAPLSLSDLEGALNPGSAGDDGGFGGGGALTSGGRIGASGVGGGPGADFEAILSVGDLDQRPRALFQSPPSYPAELRRRRVQGTVQIVFLVDTAGKVLDPKVERSSDPAFEKPALDAVRQWRFEAGTRNGHPVTFKLRIPITFSAS